MDGFSDFAAWSIAHFEWLSVWSLLVAVLQALITSRRGASWLRAPEQADRFIVNFVAGLAVVGACALVGSVIGSLSRKPALGLACGLGLGILVNAAVVVLVFLRRPGSQ